jgi:hypothetical protein
MKRLLVWILVLSGCATHSAPKLTLEDGVYEYVDGIELSLEIKGNKCRLGIWEGGATVCYLKGTFTVEGRILKLKDKQQFNSEVEEDLYNIYRCDLDYWKVTLVGEDSIRVGSFVLTRKTEGSSPSEAGDYKHF